MNIVSNDIKTKLAEHIKEIDSLTLDFLKNIEKDSIVLEAIRYSTLSEGKRIRSFLLKILADALKIDAKNSLRVGMAIELTHSFSLIHDDLPCMDNDDYRRNQPSCHKKFDEATALLAGDALYGLSFEILADNKTHLSPDVRIKLISAFAKKCGLSGLIGGQSLDIGNEQRGEQNSLELINKLKTGALFAFSTLAPAIMMRLPTNEEVLYEAVGYEIGNLFQLVDDMVDKKIARDEDLIRGLVENLATNRLIKNNLDLKNLVHFIASQIEA